MNPRETDQLPDRRPAEAAPAQADGAHPLDDTRPLDGIRLYDSVMSGANNIIMNERNLNRINVFPVPDGDTGTNLAMTMRTIIRRAVREPDASRTMGSISRAAQENAYGNSGMIFAQYLQGLAEAMAERSALSGLDFANAAGVAFDRAYGAVAAPKEGTILTVMRTWAEALLEHVQHSPFTAAFERSVSRASQMVEQTRTMMRVLRDNNVVDSGAKGFLLFLEGMLAFIKNGVPLGNSAVYAFEEEIDLHLDETVQVDRNRFCSQFVFEGDVPREALSAMLEPFGDSLVLTGSGKTVRIHLHTDAPEQVMNLLVRNGQVVSHKADDMRIQTDVALRRKHRIGLVTDSIADLPTGFADSEQISIIPLNIVCDGTAYQDRITMTPEIFWRDVDDMRIYPSSAQPTAIAIERVFSWMQAHFDSVLAIFVSGRMSGLCRNATSVAERLSVDGPPITVIDSKRNSAAEGLLVMEAARLISEGLPQEEIAERIRGMAERSTILVSVATLRYMLRGGRVSKVKGFLLGHLPLKPVVSIDAEGRGSIVTKSFSRRMAVSSILARFRRTLQTEGILSYGIAYAESESLVADFRRQLEAAAGFPPAFVSPISSVVGLNAGKGAFTVAFIAK